MDKKELEKLKEYATRAQEQEELRRESYLKGIIDFVKWTSTIVTATILWVGNTTTSITGLPRILATAGLILLISSLATAVFTIRRVLTAWAMEWTLSSANFAFLMMVQVKALEPSLLTGKKQTEVMDRLWEALDMHKPFAQPTGFGTWVGLHVALLVAGLLLHALAQALDTP